MRRTYLPLFLLPLMLLASACSAETTATPDESAGPAVTATVPAEDATMATASPTATPAQATATSLPGATLAPEPTLQATATSRTDTVTPPPSPTSEPAAPQVISGQTAEGAFFLGAPAAPLTVIDYSDFL